MMVKFHIVAALIYRHILIGLPLSIAITAPADGLEYLTGLHMLLRSTVW
jgi:hypothetical protein